LVHYRRVAEVCGVQDRQLDTFGCANHVPERETEQPGHVFDTLLHGDERWRAEGELFAAQAHTASASCLDVSVPVRLAPEVQADDHGLPGTERTHGGVVHDAGLAPRMLQIGKRGMTGEVQGHGVDRAAGIPCERSRESHRLPAFLGSARVEQNQPSFPASRPGTQRPWACSALDLWPSTRRSRYSGATAQDRNELGAVLVAAGLARRPGMGFPCSR
jgi:hypothetical protein